MASSIGYCCGGCFSLFFVIGSWSLALGSRFLVLGSSISTRAPDSATECRVLGASLVPLSTPLALFYIRFPFGGLPNRGASLVPLSTLSFCRPNRWCHLVLPARLGRFCPLGIEVEKQGFRTACLRTGQKFQGLGLKLTAVILTFRDLASHLCQKIMRMVSRHFQNLILLRDFEKWDPDIFPKSEISKKS